MNAHRFRSMLRRRNLAPLTAFFLLSLVFCFGLSAGTAQSDEKDEREVVEKIPNHLPIKVKINSLTRETPSSPPYASGGTPTTTASRSPRSCTRSRRSTWRAST